MTVRNTALALFISCFLFFTSASEQRLLPQATYNSQLNNVRTLLLSTNQLVDETDVHGFSSLMIAAAVGDHEIVNVLLDAQANVNFLDPDSLNTPLLSPCFYAQRTLDMFP